MREIGLISRRTDSYYACFWGNSVSRRLGLEVFHRFRSGYAIFRVNCAFSIAKYLIIGYRNRKAQGFDSSELQIVDRSIFY
jgi:hypothetical protein